MNKLFIFNLFLLCFIGNSNFGMESPSEIHVVSAKQLNQNFRINQLIESIKALNMIEKGIPSSIDEANIRAVVDFIQNNNARPDFREEFDKQEAQIAQLEKEIAQTKLIQTYNDQNDTAFKQFLAAGADPNVTIGIIYEERWSILRKAICDGRDEIATILLENEKTDPNATDPLKIAAGQGKDELIKLFLKNKNLFPDSISKALISAALNARLNSVQLLLEHGANPNYTLPFNPGDRYSKNVGRTPLHAAADAADFGTLTVNPTFSPSPGGGPLLVFSLSEEEEQRRKEAPEKKGQIVRLLLQAGANPNAKDGLNRTPLDIAILAANHSSYSVERKSVIEALNGPPSL